MRNSASLGRASATKVRSSPSSCSTDGRVKRPVASSLASGVPGTTVKVSAARYGGSMAVASAADAAACSAERSMPPAPSRKIADSSMPAALTPCAAAT